MFYMKQSFMPKIFTSEKQKIGELGENIASRFLMKQGFSVIDRNYTKKWGELDIVVEKEKVIHFIEVKSVSCENLDNVTRGTDTYRAEDNMHPWKAKRMSRTIQTYLLDKKVPENVEWQIDLLVVYLDIKNKKAKVKVVKNIIL
jgi:putative endonuclease